MTQSTQTEFLIKPEVKAKLLEKITQFKNKKILVVGDVGVDEYVMGNVRRISPEAPVPVLEVTSEDCRIGLAANVAQNVVSLGGKVQLVSVIGADQGAEILKGLLAKANVDSDGLVIDEKRPTTRKMRVMTGHHHLVRVDHEVVRPLSTLTEEKVFNKISEKISDCDVILMEDYAKGIFSISLVEKIVTLAKKSGKYLLVDPHQTKFAEFYKGVDLIKPNYNEALALTRLHEEDFEDQQSRVLAVGRALQKTTGAKDVVVTLGKDGMAIFTDSNEVVKVPTFARKVFDVTGAGDTVIAALALGVTTGLSLAEACVLANYAAGIVVAKVGCVPCEASELAAAISM